MPDHEFLARAREALDLWEARTTEPTSNLLGTGAVRCFEAGMADLLGRKYALALPSATLALRVALSSVGVRPGDEVLVPAYDWFASAAATRSVGAVPVAIDIELPSCGMDPSALAIELTRRLPSAVVVSHLFGVPANIPSIAELCLTHGVPMIEDCSQALGAQADGRPVGSFGVYAVCSVGPGKLVDAGDGGILAAADAVAWTRAIRGSQHPTRQILTGSPAPNVDTLALRVHPMAAILAVAELEGVEAELAQRRAHLARVAATTRGAGITIPANVHDAVGQALPVLVASGLDQVCEEQSLTKFRPGQHVIEEPLALTRNSPWKARRVSSAVRLVAERSGLSESTSSVTSVHPAAGEGRVVRT